MRSLILSFLIIVSTKIISQDTLTYSTLTKPQYKTWKLIEEKWITEKYQPFLKKEKIKLSCSGCEAAYIWLVFKKNSDKTSYTIIKSKKCGNEFAGKTLNNLIKILNEINLPEEFNNTIFKTQLGSALKC